MINVLSLYADRSGCGDYRVRLPAQAINARDVQLGVHVECSDHIDADATFTGGPNGANGGGSYHIRRVDVPTGVRVVLFQRPLKAAMAGAIRWLRAHRPEIGVVVELDDDLAGVPTSNDAYTRVHPKTSPSENFRWLRQSIALADVFTCSTPAIAERYGYDRRRTFVIKNAVPSSMLDQPARTLSRRSHPTHRTLNRDRVVGWGGTVATHRGDLETTGGALADIIGADRTDGRRVSFRTVGPRDGLAEALGIQEQDIEATGWVTPDLYRAALGEMDVGIVPLADTRFNRAKSYLKALEFAAAGVPVVASRSDEHVELQRSGMPLWLVKPRRREWVRALRSILDLDDDELAELGAAHRENVRRYHTVDVRAPEWAEAFRAAARIARECMKAG